MLSAVLRSDIAIQVSIRIMETFVEMRKYMANTSLLYDRMNAIEERQIRFTSFLKCFFIIGNTSLSLKNQWFT